jgi:hypothetical protein
VYICPLVFSCCMSIFSCCMSFSCCMRPFISREPGQHLRHAHPHKMDLYNAGFREAGKRIRERGVLLFVWTNNCKPMEHGLLNTELIPNLRRNHPKGGTGQDQCSGLCFARSSRQVSRDSFQEGCGRENRGSVGRDIAESLESE